MSKERSKIVTEKDEDEEEEYKNGREKKEWVRRGGGGVRVGKERERVAKLLVCKNE